MWCVFFVVERKFREKKRLFSTVSILVLQCALYSFVVVVSLCRKEEDTSLLIYLQIPLAMLLHAFFLNLFFITILCFLLIIIMRMMMMMRRSSEEQQQGYDGRQEKWRVDIPLGSRLIKVLTKMA